MSPSSEEALALSACQWVLVLEEALGWPSPALENQPSTPPGPAGSPRFSLLQERAAGAADRHRVYQSPDGTLLIHNLRARDEGLKHVQRHRGSRPPAAAPR